MRRPCHNTRAARNHPQGTLCLPAQERAVTSRLPRLSKPVNAHVPANKGSPNKCASAIDLVARHVVVELYLGTLRQACRPTGPLGLVDFKTLLLVLEAAALARHGREVELAWSANHCAVLVRGRVDGLQLPSDSRDALVLRLAHCILRDRKTYLRRGVARR